MRHLPVGRPGRRRKSTAAVPHDRGEAQLDRGRFQDPGAPCSTPPGRTGTAAPGRISHAGGGRLSGRSGRELRRRLDRHVVGTRRHGRMADLAVCASDAARVLTRAWLVLFRGAGIPGGVSGWHRWGVRHLSLQAEDGLPPIWDGGDLRPIRAFSTSEPLAMAMAGWERASYSSAGDVQDALLMGCDVAQWMANELSVEVDYEDGFVYRPRRPPAAYGANVRSLRQPTFREHRLDLESGASDRDHHLSRLESGWRFEFAEDLVEIGVEDGLLLRFGAESIQLSGPFSLSTGAVDVQVDPVSGTEVDRALALNYDLLVDGLVLLSGDLQLRFAGGAELRSAGNDEYQPWEISGRSFK